jgi:TonB family protein
MRILKTETVFQFKIKYISFVFGFLFLFLSKSLISQIEQPIFLKSELDQLPENYGGNNELIRILYEQINYPIYAINQKLDGKVIIRFSCSEKGEINNYSLASSTDTIFNKDAIKIFRMLQWNPGFKNKKAVASDNAIEIPFSYKKYKKQFRKKKKLEYFDTPEDTSLVIYQKAETIPTFIHGNDSLGKFIGSSLEYPHEALLKNIEGVVKLGFVVEKNGCISNVNVLKQLGGGCQEEAVRILTETNWKPAIKNGKRVRFQMEYSFYFQLKNYVKDNLMKSQTNSQY